MLNNQSWTTKVCSFNLGLESGVKNSSQILHVTGPRIWRDFLERFILLRIRSNDVTL